MGTAADGGKGFKGRAAGGGERPIGAASCRQQHNHASCQCPPRPGLCLVGGGGGGGQGGFLVPTQPPVGRGSFLLS